MSPLSNRKVVVVIGATGAQGIAVIKALLAPSPDGKPSPYAVRGLTRNLASNSAKELQALGVELVEGSVMDFSVVESIFEGAYGAFVNTDSNTIGEEAEVFAGMRIFELAKQQGIKHYVWSNLDYVAKKTGYKPQYRAEQYDGKGRVAEWLKAQDSDESGLTWSVLTTGPYMEMLNIFMFGPLNKREDGTFVFASPVGSGHVAMVSIKDLAFFARYIFDHPRETSAQDLEIASDIVGWDRVVATFTKVTGEKAVFLPQTIDEWFENFNDTHFPAAFAFLDGFRKGEYQDKTSFKKNFSAFWSLWRDDIIKRDMEWVRSINPGTDTLETWMKRVGYSGESQASLLKSFVESGGVSINQERIRQL